MRWSLVSEVLEVPLTLSFRGLFMIVENLRLPLRLNSRRLGEFASWGLELGVWVVRD